MIKRIFTKILSFLIYLLIHSRCCKIDKTNKDIHSSGGKDRNEQN